MMMKWFQVRRASEPQANNIDDDDDEDDDEGLRTDHQTMFVFYSEVGMYV